MSVRVWVKLVAGDADFVGGEAVEHEGVVGVGAVGDVDFLNGGGNGHRVLGVPWVRDAPGAGGVWLGRVEAARGCSRGLRRLGV